MDYEGLKEQWSEVEDRDGVRLSWNVFPSSRVVSLRRFPREPDHLITSVSAGSISSRRAYRRSLHTLEGEARHASTPARAHHLQTTMPLCPKSFLVSGPSPLLSHGACLADFLAPFKLVKSMFGHACGSAHSVYHGILYRPITRTSTPMLSRPSCTPPTLLLSIDCRDRLRALQSSCMLSTLARKMTVLLL